MILRRLVCWLALLAPCAVRAADAERTLYSSDQLVAEITANLQRHFHSDGEFQLDLLRPWAPPARSAVRWEFAIAEYPGIPAVNMLLRIRLKADGVLVDNSSLMVHAALMREVWFARDPIPSGTTFSPALVEARRTDVLTQRDGVAAKDGDDSMVVARELPADRMLTWHDIARRSLVHRGEMVEVRASEGQLLLTMKALAMQNGARGDLVNVQNIETRRTIPAVVVGDDKVEIHF